MKKRIWIFLLPVLCAGILYAVFARPFGYHRILNTNWKWDLPAGYTEQYSMSEAGFHGDGLRYHILAYRKGSAETINRMFLAAEPGTEAHPVAGETSGWLKELGVPETKWPPYDACVCISAKQEDGSSCVLFWNPDAGILYAAESFY